MERLIMKKEKNRYHHGNLAESLLDAADEIATKFGLEAVTLRACAKLVGVSPSSAFRHYSDKRALMTAFATRATKQLCQSMIQAKNKSLEEDKSSFIAVSLAYIRFALERPAFFRAMWRDENLYTNNEDYLAAMHQLNQHLQEGFANTIDDNDPNTLSAEELLAWSSVHGLAHLLVDSPMSQQDSQEQKLDKAKQMLHILQPTLIQS